MQRSVFIGSSSEALDQATSISKLLSSVLGITPLLWKKAFPLGALTFENIERLAQKVVGAVFLATPDDWALIRRQEVRIPRANVLLEWGYLTAILGRNRVIICEYDGVLLPADVKGLTTCRMGQFSSKSPRISLAAERALKAWAKHLPAVLEGHPLARVLHGYTGVWAIRIDYEVWRGISIRAANTVHFAGNLQLIIGPDGERGSGLAYGKVFITVQGCSAIFRLTDLEVSVRCQSDGSLVMISEPYTRQLNEPIIGAKPPQEDGFVERLPDPNRFEIRLRPTSDGVLSGQHQTFRGRSLRSKGLVICERLI
jgi:hypothetical protein